MFDFSLIIKIKIVISIKVMVTEKWCSIIKSSKLLNPSKQIIAGHVKLIRRLQGLLVALKPILRRVSLFGKRHTNRSIRKVVIVKFEKYAGIKINNIGIFKKYSVTNLGLKMNDEVSLFIDSDILVNVIDTAWALVWNE